MPYRATRAITIEECPYQDGQPIADHHSPGAIRSALRMKHIAPKKTEAPKQEPEAKPKATSSKKS